MIEYIPLNYYQDIGEKIKNIIYKMVRNNNVLDLNRLLNICVKEIKAEKMAILSVIQYLEDSNQIHFGKKIIRDFVLENEYRKSIYNYVKSSTAVCYSDLQNFLNFSPGMIQWNLEILIEFHCLKVLLFGKRKIYCIEDTPNDLAIMKFILRNKNLHVIIQEIVKQPSTIGDLSDILKLSESNVYQKVKSLVSQKIVEFILIGEKKGIRLLQNYRPIIEVLL